jgi:hypothetical protein
MLYLIELDKDDIDFKVTKLANKELVAKYVKNNFLSKRQYILIDGTLLEAEDRHIFDGRFQS